ncbi:MAG: hypothetical protein Q4G14_00980 [Paracoccus sp. (in: a-proteobacteria)]|uniref:hypothetical protein n=1 Tax=Paracoccus sp. TaxID=267 RepID=UPI0026DF5C85|nr:hypothetical protein [Paracoccus sp. (in: a-proteobacteria)]MDO5611801.1 hypothetical protein [Paracoccus sp. (in: a-proteobacteria)]
MVKKILMLVLPLVAFIGGAFGGDMLRGGAKADAAAAAPDDEGQNHAAAPHEAPAANGAEGAAVELAWFGFANQFFVPIVRNGKTDSMMILTVSLEVTGPSRPKVENMEARLRDALLRSLMIHANTGGFDGNFTADARLEPLRSTLLNAAQRVAGPDVHAVLIEDIARKEV